MTSCSNLMVTMWAKFQKLIGYSCLIFVVLHSHGLNGDQIYKTVDEDGNVTYTTEPPEESVSSQSIDLLPEPDEADIQAAQQRQAQLQQELEAAEQQRQEQAQAQQQDNESSTTVIYANPPVVPLYVPPYYGRERNRYDRWPHRPAPY